LNSGIISNLDLTPVLIKAP